MEKLLDFLQTPLAASIGGAILAIGAWLLSAFMKWSEKKHAQKVSMLNSHLEGRGNLIEQAIINVYKSYTEKLKTTGKWTAETAEIAMQKCFEVLINLMPKFLLKIAKAVYPDFEATLKEKIQTAYEAIRMRMEKTGSKAISSAI